MAEAKSEPPDLGCVAAKVYEKLEAEARDGFRDLVT
jgi:hypothetical protein